MLDNNVQEKQAATKKLKTSPKPYKQAPAYEYKPTVISKRVKKFAQPHRGHPSPKSFVDTFSGGAERAGEVANQILNGLKKSIAEDDVREWNSRKHIDADLGFWTAAVKYSENLLESKKRK